MQHDAVEFLQKLLSGMRDVEFLADRIGTTAGVEVRVVTHVERMLSFWEEQRLRCDVCGACRNAFELNNMVVLPLPSQEEAAMTVSDLYLRYCGGETLDGDSAVECARCRRRTKHAMQRRVVRWPNVLLLQARRTKGGCCGCVAA